MKAEEVFAALLKKAVDIADRLDRHINAAEQVVVGIVALVHSRLEQAKFTLRLGIISPDHVARLQKEKPRARHPSADVGRVGHLFVDVQKNIVTLRVQQPQQLFKYLPRAVRHNQISVLLH